MFIYKHLRSKGYKIQKQQHSSTEKKTKAKNKKLKKTQTGKQAGKEKKYSD